MSQNRVVITGLGLVTPIGTGNDKFWKAAVAGQNGVRPLVQFDPTEFRTKTGGEVLDFDASSYLSQEEIERMGRSSQFAVAAAKMAVQDAALSLEKVNPYRIAVSMGTTMGEPQILEKCVKIKYKTGSAQDIPSNLPRQYPCGAIPANVARTLGARGPLIIIPTACAAGNYAIGYGYDLIQLGKVDMVIAGGSDPFSGIAFTGFNRLLATTPDVCRPFDLNRSGMAVSEGSGILIMERLDHALARGAQIYAEILGYGLGCDAFKMTIPDPDGNGGIMALNRALKNTGIAIEDIDYISAHGTGTGENDKIETFIVKSVLKDYAYKVPMSSIKSMIGHTMGAASAIEAAACAMMIRNNVMLPTINYKDPDPECDIDCVPNTSREAELNTVISNAYAFAGNCSALVLRKFKG
ncbi:MAG TPA: beta-ketoacyl-[acyl-carrier-protein] synthase family protein [Chitinispirillaceae bacterium]|nr:beta-ketoacyl-[acyl-carrier-protein] synthase family protein [Chitinispirillaceae bacterium]